MSILKIVNKSNNPLPKYETVLSAGMDFPKELWIEAINEAFASKAKLIPMNVEAFNKGRDFVS